jgi:CBS domain-containing protein
MSGGSTHSPKLVRDLMTVGVVTCAPDTPITEVARLLLDRDLEGVAVLDQEGHSIGVVSRDELVRAYARDDARELKAEDVMREGIVELPPDIPLAAAAQLMQDMGVRLVFLMHHEHGISWPAAMLSYRHFLRHLAAQSDDELSDLGIKAERRSPIEIFVEKRDAARRRAGLPTQDKE